MKKREFNHFISAKVRIIVIGLVLMLWGIAVTSNSADPPKSAEELRQEAAVKAAALAKPPPGGHWKATAEEALEALELTGDPEEGEDIYNVCAACHFPTGWGDPLGVFPQLAGQHTNVLIKQIADIRAKNRDNPTMYPFAMQIDGAQDIVDVCAYIQTREMNPNPRVGPGGPSFVLSNLRKEVWPISLDKLQQTVGDENFKKLKNLEETDFKSQEGFLTAVSKEIGAGELEKHKSLILENANWTTDLELGKKLYEENCVRCHGDHGQGNWKQPAPAEEGQANVEVDKNKMVPGYFPVLAGQTYLYLVRQFSWIQIGKRRNANPDMIKQIQKFSFLDMKSVVDYASRFKMQEGDWQEVGDVDEEGWDLDGEEKEDEDMPAHLK